MESTTPQPLILASAARPVTAILFVLAVIAGLDWLILRFITPWISMTLGVVLTIMATFAGIAIVVSAGDAASHLDHRAQNLTGLALVLAIVGPTTALVVLLVL